MSELIKEAKLYVDMLRDCKNLTEREQTDAVTLARVTTMLAVYGSKTESILMVIHEKGFPDVTLNDVEEIRQYVLGGM